MIEIFPIWEGVYDGMACFFFDVGEDGHLLVLQEDEGVLEVEVSEIGYHFCVLSILVEEFLGRNKFIVIHSSSPDDVDRHHQNILTPLLLHLQIDLPKLFVAEWLAQVFEKG